MNRLILLVLGIILMAVVPVIGAENSTEQQSNISAEELVAFVEQAYTYAQTHGKEAALEAFNDQNGSFVKGDMYIFAYDFDGNTLALPFEPELIGQNRLDMKDVMGIYFVRELRDLATNGSGFTAYQYRNPAHNMTIEPKMSYAMKVDDNWWIGAGTYKTLTEPPFILDVNLKTQLLSYINAAVSYANKEGKEAALKAFNDKNSSFVKGPLYIYAFDYNGTCLALPYQQQLIGTDLYNLTDAYGVRFTEIEINLAYQGGGWIYYHYPNPAKNMTVEPKISYVSRVDETWWIGAGVYPSDVEEIKASLL